jgi:hypothetical protein
MPEVQIPDRYNTFETVVGLQTADNFDANEDPNKKYNLITRQAIPLILLGKFVDPDSNLVESSVEFVCMTANNTVKGSRVPEQETPWKSAGTKISAGLVGWTAAVVTTMMLVL